METIQVTIEDSLLAEVQQVTNALQITPSDFIKVALERAVQQREIIANERRDARGYAEHRNNLKRSKNGWMNSTGMSHETGRCLLVYSRAGEKR